MKVISNKPYIIAEIGNNHEGNFNNATRLIEAAKKSGANAAKFQTFIPELYHTQLDEDRMEALKRFQLSFKQFEELALYSHELGLDFISTPFDFESLFFLSSIADAIKISSGDSVWIDFVEEASKLNAPLIISTGATTNSEIQNSLKVAYKHKKKDDIFLLHCTSDYPAKEENSNMLQFENLKEMHQGPMGFSDHTRTNIAALLAFSMGARIFEKHITLDNNFSDFRDHTLSSNPKEMKILVESLREAELMLGNGIKRIQDCEESSLIPSRRSVAAAKNLSKGQKISPNDFKWIRPGNGISPGDEKNLLGRILLKDIKEGEFLQDKFFK